MQPDHAGISFDLAPGRNNLVDESFATARGAGRAPGPRCEAASPTAPMPLRSAGGFL
ncbi:hypothetical protein JOE48_000721 [Methylobacterium sp. PvR107]|nr:hypothetical protein [Methylobacterium sp. PvR107]